MKKTRTPRKSSRLLARRRAIAPEPSLPGLSGAVGIDVSKAKFNACYLASAEARPQSGVFSSDAEGHAKFLLWLERVGVGQSLHLCLEETGCYGRALGAFLHQCGHHVSIVNAALIKHFGRSLNLRTKNDSVDARLIAQYTLERRPARWVPLNSSHQALRDAARRREQLMQMIGQERNHLEAAAANPQMVALIEASLLQLKAQCAEVEQLMAEIASRDEQLAHNVELLDSIPGIGPLTALLLLAELPPLDSFGSARQLCAYAGLTPRENQSGTSLNGPVRLCKQGRGVLRKVLFMPAVCLLKTKSGPLKDFAERLLKAAKKPACVVGALMRKLMTLVYAIITTGRPYDPCYPRQCLIKT